MKKTYLSLIALFATLQFSYAQWTGGSNIYNTNSGNVGIGTTNPVSPLEIFQLSGSKPSGVSAPTASVLKISRIGTANYSYNESAEFRIGHGGPSAWGSQVDLFVNGASNQTNIPDQHAMTWLYNGNVGIGTITPNAPLHIVKASIPYTNVNMQTWGPSIANYDLTLSNHNSTWGIDYRFTQYINGAPAPVLTFQGGNVGIGTTEPQGYKLAVNGSAIATSMKVKPNGSWPDFVFLKEYNLPTLTEVKTYIDKNQHLPDMPSADEVHTNGLDLGEMNRLLLKKVEEMTLYLIQKDEKDNQQQKEIDELKQIVSSLQSKISSLPKQSLQRIQTKYITTTDITRK
ncbi:hypothetical protein [Mucilaginibacter sp. HD30]